MKKKAIIVSGYFNPVHKGHIEYFNKAKAQGDKLFVIVNNDFQRELKGSKEFQTDSVRGELNGAITGVAVANDNTFGLNPALNVRRAPSARRQVDVQANTAILTELVSNLNWPKWPCAGKRL